MLRSLYSGISGLHAHQQMMDVTGNNIANVNTVGYKASVVQFQDTLSQMLGAAGAPQNGQGGTNPAQVGLGVRNAGIMSNWSQGSQETTGRAGDMMIQGDGFFIARSGNEDLYTRAGSFSFDANGKLVTATGDSVQGWTATNGVVNAAGKPGDIVMPLGATISPKGTSAITLKGNLSSDDVPDPLNPTNSGTNYVTTIPKQERNLLCAQAKTSERTDDEVFSRPSLSAPVSPYRRGTTAAESIDATSTAQPLRARARGCLGHTGSIRATRLAGSRHPRR